MNASRYFLFFPKPTRTLLCLRFALAMIVLSAIGEMTGAEIPNVDVSNPSRKSEAVIRALSPEAARTHIADLRAEIAHHDDLYFKKSAPEISDAGYDLLKRELAALEKRFPEQAKGISPTESLGDDRTGGFPLYRHRERMLSLDKSYSESELRAFHARVARQLGRDDLVYVIEPKFDGLAISVTYEKGKLVRAVTRGNGVEGDDVTENIRAIRALPREMKRFVVESGVDNPVPDLIELRGEVYLPLAEFRRLNREREAAGEAPFAHPRNVASGTLKQTDPTEVTERGLAIVFYGWGACFPATAAPKSQQELHALIRAWGLPGLENYTVARNADEMWKSVRAFDRERPRLGFPVDGAVVKLDSAADRVPLGATEHAPRWAMAYKFPTERVETKLLAITLQVGRSGVLTPVAELAPVKFGGSTVTRASLHNRDEIARADLRVGDFVYVEKAGEVIPAIVGVDLARRANDSVPFVFPAVCPACQTAVVAQPGEAAVRCPNPACPAQLRRRLQHFASNDGLAINGLGPVMIDALVEKGAVKTIPDLYRLRREDLLSLSGVGVTSADRLLAAIAQSKHAELWRIIHGLGIPRVGVAGAKTLARHYGELRALASANASGFAADLGAAAGVAVEKYFTDPENRALVDELVSLGL